MAKAARISSRAEGVLVARAVPKRKRLKSDLIGKGKSLREVLELFLAWLNAGNCLIQSKEGGKLVPLIPKPAQLKLLAAMLKQARRNQPVRLIVLKARKEGISTLMQAWNYFFTKEVPQVGAATVAHEQKATRDIFKITRRIYEHDPTRVDGTAAKNRRELGYNHDSQFVTMTAAGLFAGSGSTTHSLHLSEVSKYSGNVQDTLMSLRGSVPGNAFTVVVLESSANRTAQGREFEEEWKAAVSGTSGYAPLFISWLEDPDYQHPVPSAGLGVLLDYEQEYVEKHAASPEQISWYRYKMRQDFRGDRNAMMQEYPTTPEEAFRVARGRIFPMLRMERHHHVAEPAAIERSPVFRAIDFGGADPFACLWIADMEGPTGLSLDIQCCPNLWRELTTWSRDEHGRPHDRGCHAIDALRYACVFFHLRRRVHVFRELYVKDAADQGLSEADLALRIVKMSTENVQATVADRSRPQSIILLTQLGVPTCAFARPQTVVQGEIEDGIALLISLMQATVRMGREPEAPPDPRMMITRLSYDLGQEAVRLGYQDPDFMIASKGRRELDLHPIFGALG